MNKLLCWIFGHKYKYNFATLSDKAICARCKTKWIIPYQSINDKWIEIERFIFTKGCERTDEELIKTWVK